MQSRYLLPYTLQILIFTIFLSLPVRALGGWGMWHARNKREVYTDFWWENLMEGNFLEELLTNGWIILKCTMHFYGVV
jgi:hypothetical protein